MNRDQLLEAANAEFERLMATVADVPQDLREVPGACETWSVKDLLAHLDAWHTMFLGWEAGGSQDIEVAMPAAGYRWSDTPALNQAIHDQTVDDAWSDVNSRLHRSNQLVVHAITSYSDEELFEKKRYPWTRSTSVGSYAISATSSHYRWATKLIRAWSAASR